MPIRWPTRFRFNPLFLLSLIAFPGMPTAAAPADIDPTFGNAGVVFLSKPASQATGEMPVNFVTQLVDDSLLIIRQWYQSLPASTTKPATPSELIRLTANGQGDNAWGLDGRQTFDSNSCPGNYPGKTTFLSDGSFLTQRSLAHIGRWSLLTSNHSVCRYSAGGAYDTTFANTGALFLHAQVEPTALHPHGVDGFLVWRANNITRYLNNGRVDTALAPNVTISLPFPDGELIPSGGIPDGSGGQLIPFVQADSIGIVRLNSALTPDPAFGNMGAALAPNTQGLSLDGLLRFPDGRILAYGTAGHRYWGNSSAFILARYLADGRIDQTFGQQGTRRYAHNTPVFQVKAAIQSDGGIVVGLSDGTIRRFNSDGDPDLGFVTEPQNAGLQELFIQNNGRIILISDAGEGALRLIALEGGAVSASPPKTIGPLPDANHPVANAIEYYHAEYDHYFVTANPTEIAALDAGNFRGWKRTDAIIPVWTTPHSGLDPVCRFLSHPMTGERQISSHFYTPSTSECDYVAAAPQWQLESMNIFYLRIPERIDGGLFCPVGTQPLYRAYNNGLSGASNHRYTTSPTILDNMIGQGWIFEGDAQTRVFSCIPS